MRGHREQRRLRARAQLVRLAQHGVGAAQAQPARGCLRARAAARLATRARSGAGGGRRGLARVRAEDLDRPLAGRVADGGDGAAVVRHLGALVSHAIGEAALARRAVPQPGEGEEAATQREQHRVAFGVQRVAVEVVEALGQPRVFGDGAHAELEQRQWRRRDRRRDGRRDGSSRARVRALEAQHAELSRDAVDERARARGVETHLAHAEGCVARVRHEARRRQGGRGSRSHPTCAAAFRRRSERRRIIGRRRRHRVDI